MSKLTLWMAIAWISNFILLLAWSLVGLVTDRDTKLVGILQKIFGLLFLLLVISYHFVLAISWAWVAVLVLILATPTLHSVLRGSRRRVLNYDEVTMAQSIFSWLCHAATLFLVAVLIKSPLWISGATILLVYGLTNLYFETLVKRTLRLLEESEDHIHSSGVPVQDEIVMFISAPTVALLFFPILYYFPQVAKVVEGLATNSTDFVLVVVLTFFGVVTTFFASVLSGLTIEVKRAYAALYRGFNFLILFFIALAVSGYSLRSLEFLSMTKALSREYLFVMHRAWPDVGLLFGQIWLAAMLTSIGSLISCSLTLVFILMGGRGDFKDSAE